jgi:hypothetical protein
MGARKDYLTNEEVQTGIAQASRRIDLFGCDACLTGTIDLVRAVVNHADYYVASETITRREGWPYQKIIRALRRDPAMTPEKLARTIVELFPAARNEAIAAWDLSGVQKLLVRVDQLGDKLKSAVAVTAKRAAIVETRGRMVAMEDPDYLDLETCLDRIGTVSPAVKNVAARCKVALKDARVARSARSSLSGMAILIPNQDPRRVLAQERGPAPPPPLLPPPSNGWNRFVRQLAG